MKGILSLLSLAVLFLNTPVAHAQESVSSTSAEASGSSGNTSYVVGQVAYKLISGSSGSAAPGVQQPFEISITELKNDLNQDLVISVYPNPSPGDLRIKTKGQFNSPLSYELQGQDGRPLKSGMILEELTLIPLNSLSGGIYILQVFDDQEVKSTFKIIKAQ